MFTAETDATNITVGDRLNLAGSSFSVLDVCAENDTSMWSSPEGGRS